MILYLLHRPGADTPETFESRAEAITAAALDPGATVEKCVIDRFGGRQSGGIVFGPIISRPIAPLVAPPRLSLARRFLDSFFPIFGGGRKC